MGPAMPQPSTYTMTKKSTAFPGDVETQAIDDVETDTLPPSQQEQIRRTRKRPFLLLLVLILLLLVAAILPYAAYSLVKSISEHTSKNDMVDRVIASAGLYKRDELGGGQIVGIVVGVLVLLAFIGASLWMFNFVAAGVNRASRSGQ